MERILISSYLGVGRIIKIIHHCSFYQKVLLFCGEEVGGALGEDLEKGEDGGFFFLIHSKIDMPWRWVA